MILAQNLFLNGHWSSKLDTSLDSCNTLIMGFYDRQDTWSMQLKELNEAFPKSVIVGCSTAGEIYSDRVYDHSLSVSICKFEKTDIKLAQVDFQTGTSSFELGAELSNKINEDGINAILVLCDGLNLNGSELTRGLKRKFKNTDVSISGGLAGDGSRFKQTDLLIGSQLRKNSIVAISFYGDTLKVGTGSVGGWDEFGPERTVTKAKDNILFELDGEPALAIYKRYLGDQASGLPASGLLFPLSVSFEQRKNVVRTILGVDEASQSLIFAGDIPLNSKVQLMRANFTRLVEGARQAGLSSILKLNSEKSSLAIAVSCVGRRLVLGERVEDELEAIKKILPKGSVIGGFYSYGELSPNGEYGCELHNQTMTLTVFQE